MKKLLTGFTLAEILITLAIIGVVARVTLPALMSNVREQQTTTTLSKALNTLELGNQRIFTNTSSTTLTGAGVAISLSASSNNSVSTPDDWALQPAMYLNLLGSHLNGQYITKNYTIDGTSKANTPVFLSKDGIAFVDASSVKGVTDPKPKNDKPKQSGSARTVPEKYDGKYAKILVDLNGADNPNKIGKDQFLFFVDNKGAAIPYGGYEYSKYALASSNMYELSGNSLTMPNTILWEDDCKADANPTSVSGRASCTGSIIDNGFKIIYNY